MTNYQTAGQSIAANYDLYPSDLFEALKTLVSIKRPAIIWGQPGLGKSSVCMQVAEALKLKPLDVRINLLDAVDLRGIPWRDPDTGQTKWAPPDFLPREDSTEGHLLILDELASGKPSIQAALYQLVLDRRLGEYTLPENVAIVACSNRETDRAVVHQMPTPLASRFIHLNMAVSNTDWRAWAIQNNLSPEVIFFLQYRPDLLLDFNPESADRAFPCPRTWHFVSDIISSPTRMSADVERSILIGTVGAAAAVEFSAFLDVCRELPNPQMIIEDPDNAQIPVNDSQLIALCGSLYRLADPFNMSAISTYAKRLRREIGQYLVDACVTRDPCLRETSGYIDWAVAQSN